MDAQELRNLQEAYMEVVEGREGGRFEYNQRHGRPLITPEISQRASSQETLGGGTYERGPKRLPKSKRKYDKQVLSGVRAASEQEKQRARKRMGIGENYDLYDIILSHLLDEGYADTEQAAEAIMVNMSEDWRESIVEMSDFEAGGGNAKMAKTGMSKDQVIALGKKNIAAKPSSSASSNSSNSSNSSGGIRPGDYNINVNFGPKKEPKQQPQPYTPSEYSSKGPRRKYTPDAQSIFRKPGYDVPSFADMKDAQMRSQAQDSDEWLVRAGKQKPGENKVMKTANATIAKQRAYYGQK